MGQPYQTTHPAGSIPKENIHSLSWKIATEPKLYSQLASNPYNNLAVQIISERFPNSSIQDVICAVILAEREGNYDRNFKKLTQSQQDAELIKQKENSARINNRLTQYYNKYAKECSNLANEAVFRILCKVVFETDDLKEIEQTYAQSLRRDVKLSIANFIEDLQKLKSNTQKNDDITFAIVASGKKTAYRQVFLKAAFGVLSLILLFYIPVWNLWKINKPPLEKKQILGVETHGEIRRFPVRLKIPGIDVNAPIQQLGVNVEREMEVPDNTSDVGWYKLGVLPGEKGSAVIAGHLDSKNNKAGVFDNLHKLKTGDKLYVEDNQGKSTVFAVRESRIYDPGYAEDVFGLNDSAHLNLITCEGIWNKDKKSYSKRLVVFADIMY